ncbi:MAG: CRTAC1 family protein [Actinomycetota bacterium]
MEGGPGRSIPRVVAALLLTVACTGAPSPASVRTGTPTPDVVRYRDVAEDVGISFHHGAFRWEVSADPGAMLGGGVCWLDYDEDGWVDLYAVNSYANAEASRWANEGGLPANALFHNVEGRFEDVSEASGAGLAMRGNGCVAADFDLDGHTDLYVTATDASELLWNRGDGTFERGAEAAGVQAFGWRAGATVGDVNEDGWPDLFVSGYVDLNVPIEGATIGFPNTYAGVRDLLFLNEGRGDGDRVTFREVGMDAGLEVANFEYGLGAVFSDLDVDGDLDLYLANDSKPNRLYDNVPWPGGAEADPAGLGFRFEELAARAGVADPNAGMGVADGDFDGDARPDLFVTNARAQVHAAYRGQVSELVDPSFADVRDGLGVALGGSTGWGVSWNDLDLDTDLDLVLVNGGIPVRDLAADAEPVQAFGNLTAQGRVGLFEDLGTIVGLHDVGPLVARGSAAADYDNDGDLDIAINSIGGPLVLLESSGAAGNWLEVAVDRFASGALLEAVLPDGRTLVRESFAGSSYLSSEDPRFHLGLGTHGRVADLTVRWPGGEETVLEDVAANQIVVVEAPG